MKGSTRLVRTERSTPLAGLLSEVRGGCVERFIRPRALKPQKNHGLRKSGVLRVNLYKEGAMTKAIVKHLVADAFLARRGEDVRIIDGDFMNCAVSNLQLVK